MQIGDYQISVIETGSIWLDGGAMFGSIPKTLWSRKVSADEDNRIELSMRCMLIEGNNRTILVDCGLGDKGNAKFRKIYKVASNDISIISALRSKNLECHQITDVLLTHLHFDHAGGVSRQCGPGYQLTFPKATYHVQATQWQCALKPNIREKASYLPEVIEPLLTSGQLHLLKGAEDLWPGIHIHISDGHSQGQQLIRVSDERHNIFFCGDLIPTSHHVPVAWVMGYDVNALKLIEEKENILSKAAQDQWLMVFQHDPDVTAAYIGQTNKDFIVTHTIKSFKGVLNNSDSGALKNEAICRPD